MKRVSLIFALASSLLVLNSCSAGGPSSPGTVFAQQGYSTASVAGTYSITFYSSGGNLLFQQGSSIPYAAIGDIQFSGAGSITSGTISLNGCQYSLSGTYNIQSTALGTASLSLTPSSGTSSGACPTATTLPLSLAASQQGVSILFVASSGTPITGTAIKQ